METKELIEQLEWWAEECDRTNHGCQARKILQEAADALDKLKKCRHECKIDCLLEEYEKKKDELEKVRRERDAAIKDWKGFCTKCAWNGKQYLADGQMDARCKTCRENGKCNWEWRGVKEGRKANER